MDEARPQWTDNVEALNALVQRQADALAARETQLAERDAQIESLNERIRRLLAQRFGASSEQVSDLQLGLFNEAEAQATPEDSEGDSVEVPAHRRRRAGRAPLPEHLPREDVIHELAQAERVCPHDATVLEPFGEECSEQLDIVPAKICVLRHRRVKYRCPCCERHVRTAPMTPQPIPKSQASPGLLAYVAVSKYADALPLYRQSKQFERIGVELSRSTLASWMVRAGALIEPLVNLLRDRLLEGGYIQIDETTVQVLKEPRRAPEKKSYLWAQRGGEPEHPVIVFDYDPSRSGAVARRLLAGFTGYLQTDGYEGYRAVVNENPIVQLYCFAHARRRFTEALKAAGLNPKRIPHPPPSKARLSLKGLGFIRRLYAIEHGIRSLPPDERYRVRADKARPVLEALRAWLDNTRDTVLPSSPLGDALAYLDAHWAGLNRYCEDGRLEIDNNRIENAIRPFVVGRKNWLFSDTVHGAKASANLYSLIETAKANRLEPYAYLRRVFTELPKADTVEAIEALLPENLNPTTTELP